MDPLIAYAFGHLDREASFEFEEKLIADDVLRKDVQEWQEVLFWLDRKAGVAPPATAKWEVMDALVELAKEEAASGKPKVLTEASTAADYAPWLQMPEHQPPADFDNLFYIPIAQNEDGATIIVWIKGRGLVPEEVHNDAIEKFLVLEGSCEISFNGERHELAAGDFLSIPLHFPHVVRVTSEINCKLIVQRIAA